MFKDGFDGVTLLEGPIKLGEINIKNFFWPVLGIAFLVYVIISAILMYHWRKYGMGSKRIVLAQIVYFVGSIAIFAVAIISLSLMK